MSNIGQDSILQLFKQAFLEVKDLPLPPLTLHGRFYDRYTFILRQVTEKLGMIRRDLPIGVLKPKNSMGKVNAKLYHSLPELLQLEIDELRVVQEEAIESLIDEEIYPLMKNQVILNGILDMPQNYHAQESKNTGAVANFRMIFEEITGLRIDEKIVQEAINASEDNEQNRELEILLQLLKTAAFKKDFPDFTIQTIPLIGTDFDDIVSMVTKLRAQVPKVTVFCLATIESEIATDGILSVIVESVDEDTVVAHDPIVKTGRAYKVFQKDNFIKRWGKTFLTGNLVLVVK
jgi:hypothetical protein